MKILLVVPKTDLLYAEAESQDILNSGLVVKILKGDVTQIDLLRYVAQVDSSYDIIWFCTHGTKEGILLSDGIFPANLVTSLVRNKFSVVVLNTCDSYATAQMLQNETNATVIATVQSVPDSLAYQTGSLFAYWLHRTNNISLAYQYAKPGNNVDYIMLAGKKK